MTHQNKYAFALTIVCSITLVAMGVVLLSIYPQLQAQLNDLSALKAEVRNYSDLADRITGLENKIQMLTPEPNTPETTTTTTTTPEPTTPEATTTESTTSESTTPEPTTTESITPESTTTESTTSESTTPEPTLTDEERRIAHCAVINSMEDESITASSVYNHRYGPKHSRLNTRSGNGGWCPHPFEGSWIEIDMGSKKTVRGVATQGSSRSDHPYWVESFTIGFKTSTSSSFQYIEDQSGAKNIFQGNTDADTVKVNDVDVEARFIRIYPVSWEDYPMLRFDVLLC